LPSEAEALMMHARIRLAARALHIARIDAGPAAIALTPRREFDADTGGAGLEEKNGRLLLREPTEGSVRNERVRSLLEALAA
jgi:transcription-repair coupling factor (superfamily II helicase)